MNLSKLFRNHQPARNERDLHPFSREEELQEEEDNSPDVEVPYGYYYCGVCGLVPIDRFPNCHPNSMNVQQRW